MRARAVCERYEGAAFQSQLWTGVTNFGPSSHWSAVKCVSIVIASGISDSKIWQSYSYTGFGILCRFSNDQLLL